MRILYHHRTLADGAEGIHIDAMVSAFRRLDHEVDVSTVAESAKGDRDRRQTISGVRSVLPAAAFEAAALATNGAEYFQVRKKLTSFRPQFLYKRHARFDVGALLAARRLRIPAVLEVNAIFSAPPYVQFEPMALPGAARALERWALSLASLIVAVSSPLAAQIRDLYGETPVLVIPNGADPDLFDPSLASGADVRRRHDIGEAVVIGWVGIVREWHGLELLLRAAADVRQARVLIVGDGPGRPAIERLAAALGMTERLIITGRVPHEQVRDYLDAMDIAAVAEERTGIASPMKLLEYMAMGRAVIAPRLPNLQDLITEGVDGMLFAPGDASEFRAQLSDLAGNPDRRASLGSQARAKIVSERNWPRIAGQVVDAVLPVER